MALETPAAFIHKISKYQKGFNFVHAISTSDDVDVLPFFG
jgi:hypothetical protein